MPLITGDIYRSRASQQPYADLWAGQNRSEYEHGSSCECPRTARGTPARSSPHLLAKLPTMKACLPFLAPRSAQRLCGKSLHAGSSISGFETRVVANTANALLTVRGDHDSVGSTRPTARPGVARSYLGNISWPNDLHSLNNALCRVGRKVVLIQTDGLAAAHLCAKSAPYDSAGTAPQVKPIFAPASFAVASKYPSTCRTTC